MLPDVALSPVAIAYARARGGDRVCSYGDAVAVSHEVDESLARLLDREVSDLIIAPAYAPVALDILRRKKKGGYLVLQMDPEYEPPDLETREVFGLALQQQRNTARITRATFGRILTPSGPVPEDVLQTLLVGTIALKYTQSNSVCVAYDGQVIGMGAGQQSRIHCTRLACDKADKWLLQLHPRVRDAQFHKGTKRVDKFNLLDQYLSWEQLSETEAQAMCAGFHPPPVPLTRAERHDWVRTFQGLCLCSDAFIPFRDNIDRASRTNVQYVAQTGGGLRDADVTAAAQQYGMTMIHTGVRLFAH
jgi:AICAR transformylase/IMP cyclohydrolase PurH